MKVHPYTLLGQKQYDAFGDAFRSSVSEWTTDWFSAPPKVNVSAAPIASTMGEYGKSNAIRFSDASGEHWAVFLVDKIAAAGLTSMLLCGQKVLPQNISSGNMVHALMEIALLDLCYYLLPLSGGACQVEKAPVETLLSGEASDPVNQALYLLVDLAVDLAVDSAVDLDGVAVHAWLPLRPVLSRIAGAMPDADRCTGDMQKREQAIGRQPMSCEIQLGSAELTVGMVSRLGVGDVIRLDKELQDYLYMVFKESPIRFAGYLGKQQDRFAFRVDAIHR
jgi:hypothetical protein